jgi:hypothetical protein
MVDVIGMMNYVMLKFLLSSVSEGKGWEAKKTEI